jgi:hypothetical protein
MKMFTRLKRGNKEQEREREKMEEINEKFIVGLKKRAKIMWRGDFGSFVKKFPFLI